METLEKGRVSGLPTASLCMSVEAEHLSAFGNPDTDLCFCSSTSLACYWSAFVEAAGFASNGGGSSGRAV
jgi:hypothetical protein